MHILVKYFDTIYIAKKGKTDSTVWLVSDEKDDIKVNAPIPCSIRNRIVVDTVNYPYLDVYLLDSEIALKRVAKAINGKEEYPVYELTNEFMNYIGI